ncbi:MAG: hypothetical protein LBE16_05790 [Clostridiales Family XIII bacterium]|nr:hypothetical protein [Clostridiales Family XIII bacterium]
MNEARLRVIRGGLHPAAHKTERRFSSAFATDTRLMGVFVLYIHWIRGEADTDADLHQFFYIDTEKFGLETYRGIEGNNAALLYETEQTLLGGLGGNKTDITEDEATFIIQKYSDMAKTSGTGLPAGKEAFAFILDKKVSLTSIEEDILFRKLCAPLESNEHAINYFLMRYFAKDAEAVKRLSTRPIPMSMAPNKQSETLCKNTIEPYINPSGVSYLCESLIENNHRYQLVLSEIYMNARRVSFFCIRSCFFISASEAAMMLGRPEYITIYEILIEPEDLRKTLARIYPGAMQKKRDGGCLYLQFKSNNDHLKESVYRLNDDIRGVFFVTDQGQFIAVAYSLAAINRIEKELQSAVRMGLRISERYEFKESVFYEFMQSDFLDFSDFVDYLNEFEPGE